MILDRNSIIDAQDIPVRIIDVPEWGGSVNVKRASIRERDTLGVFTRKFLEVKIDKKSGEQKTEMITGDEAEKAFAQFRLFSVGFALCDEHGNRLFNDDEIETLLGKKAPDVIDRIFNDLGNAFTDVLKPE